MQATTLVTVSSWETRQMFDLCPVLRQCGRLSSISVRDVAAGLCYGMAEGWEVCPCPLPSEHVRFNDAEEC